MSESEVDYGKPSELSTIKPHMAARPMSFTYHMDVWNTHTS